MKKVLKVVLAISLCVFMIGAMILPVFDVKAEPAPQTVSAWFVWKGSNGELFKYHAASINVRADSGTSEYPVNMIAASHVKDEATNTVFDLNAAIASGKYQWISDLAATEIETASITTWAGYEQYFADASSVDWDYEHDRFYDPMGGRVGKNSISTNANRQFRATIYGDEFKAIQFGTVEDDYKYFPSSWDPGFIDSTIDISGTTKDKPAEYDSFLLEKTLKFKNFTGADIMPTEIASVEALDVNNGAVTITKNNDEFTIKFNSNYYDKVTFKLTTSDGKAYYIRINRFVGKEYSNIGEYLHNAADKLQLGLVVYYDSSTSYKDYEVKANVTYNDGSSKTLDAEFIDSAYENPETGQREMMNEMPAGKNMKAATFAIEGSANIKAIDFTVLKKGALDGETYGGTFAGSGKGISFDNELLTKFIHDAYTD